MVENCDGRPKLFHFGEIVGRVADGSTVACQLLHEVEQLDSRLDVSADSRLVEKQNRGMT